MDNYKPAMPIISMPIISIDSFKKNKQNCKDYELLYIKCMKQNIPIHNKCKKEFELWYDCFKMFKY